ncbi:50S ribosomal protein L3 N(5)-glutamine methyltransferase [Bermanella sp. R86510]|uniref:50S ribosomal protein L3 N(5)-glutamine methyltransferase n=1 Tax=unclassified Bermanella TaxID=2627862 RepID=UPI0037CADE6D
MTHYSQAITELDSILDWVRFAASEFERNQLFYGHGTDNPWDEALALVTACLHMPVSISKEQAFCKLTTDERQEVAKFIEERVQSRKPVAYITNQAWFCGMPFYVDERVLVPRSPIAELIQNRFSPWLDGRKPTRILDLCCGSGCIGIAALQAFPHAQLDLADLSRDALDVAEINIERHGLFDQVAAIESDLFDQLHPGYDLIISNPPYVDFDDLADMPEEFHHEPEMGLGSGNDGLDITRRILAQASDYLAADGVLVVEVGNSWVNLEAAFPSVPFTWVEFEHGGHGVFVMTKQELEQHQAQFRV